MEMEDEVHRKGWKNGEIIHTEGESMTGRSIGGILKGRNGGKEA